MEKIAPQRTLNGDECLQTNQPSTIDAVHPSILIDNEDYCVIDKPPSVRMDGNFPVTVEKLVTSWIGADAQSIKWVHQLDFATSGVLCIARNREAAAAVVSSFEHRDVRKSYLAVLQGHVMIEDWPLRAPASDEPSGVDFEEGLMQEFRLELQATHKKGKRKLAELENLKNNIVVWQSSVMEQNLRNCQAALASYSPSIDLSDLQVCEYHFLKSLSAETYQKSAKFRKQLRRFLHKVNVPVEVIDSCQETAEEQLSALAVPSTAAMAAEAAKDKEEVPLTEEEVEAVCNDYRRADRMPLSIFRLPLSSDNPQRLIIDIPIAELKEDFRMEPGHPGNLGLRAVTEMQVLERGQYCGRPVTKVLFKPISGRRHQLRIHALCLGHPIVGDYTYNRIHRRAVLSQRRKEEAKEEKEEVAARMMLHAHRLFVPFPNYGKCALPFKRRWLLRQQMKLNLDSTAMMTEEEQEEIKRKIEAYDPLTLRSLPVEIPLVDVVATDPFVFEDGQLKPRLPSYLQKKGNVWND